VTWDDVREELQRRYVVVADEAATHGHLGWTGLRIAVETADGTRDVMVNHSDTGSRTYVCAFARLATLGEADVIAALGAVSGYADLAVTAIPDDLLLLRATTPLEELTPDAIPGFLDGTLLWAATVREVAGR
jgi:hypothetical protein